MLYFHSFPECAIVSPRHVRFLRLCRESHVSQKRRDVGHPAHSVRWTWRSTIPRRDRWQHSPAPKAKPVFTERTSKAICRLGSCEWLRSRPSHPLTPWDKANGDSAIKWPPKPCVSRWNRSPCVARSSSAKASATRHRCSISARKSELSSLTALRFPKWISRWTRWKERTCAPPELPEQLRCWR